jgi:CRP/FNR family cyclic AMP-dependent transcriptional regulator
MTPNGVSEFHFLSHGLEHPCNLSLSHAPGTVLFTEEEPARGVYVLLTGRATLSISSSEGKIIILRVAEAGDVLGLSSSLRNCTYDATVKTLGPCRTDFIARAELARRMQECHRCTHAVVMTLSHELTDLSNRARLLCLSQTSSSRLAKLLLEWGTKSAANGSSVVRIGKSFTQEQIAQMIGASRETVTRLLTNWSRRQIIEITVDSIFIRDWGALKSAARHEDSNHCCN